MIQIILTYIIVGVAVAYTLWKIVGFFISKKGEDTGCGGACGCSAKQQFANTKK